MRSTLWPTLPQILYGSEQFQLVFQNWFDSLETTSNMNEMADKVVKTVCTYWVADTSADEVNEAVQT